MSWLCPLVSTHRFERLRTKMDGKVKEAYHAGASQRNAGQPFPWHPCPQCLDQGGDPKESGKGRKGPPTSANESDWMLGGPYLSGLPTLFHWTGTAAVASSVSDIPKAKQPAEHAAIAADARMEERGDMEERAACDGTRGGQAGQVSSAVTHCPHRLY